MADPRAVAHRSPTVHAAVREMAWCALVLTDAIDRLEESRAGRVRAASA